MSAFSNKKIVFEAVQLTFIASQRKKSKLERIQIIIGFIKSACGLRVAH